MIRQALALATIHSKPEPRKKYLKKAFAIDTAPQIRKIRPIQAGINLKKFLKLLPLNYPGRCLYKGFINA